MKQRMARHSSNTVASNRCLWTLLCLPLLAHGAALEGPDARTFLAAQANSADWLLPARTYPGNRYISLTQIDKINVGNLDQAWRAAIADDGEQEAAPIVWNGQMYLSTPHGGVLAIESEDSAVLRSDEYFAVRDSDD
jgi:glucose dehydrogenase